MLRKVVFAPLSNTYSHISDCLAVADILAKRGYQPHFLVSHDKQGFIASCGYPTTVTLELWERSGKYEVMSWFDDPLWFREVAINELMALKSLNPDIVVGSYRYTTSITSQHLRIPYFSIIGPNMSTAFKQYLGIPNKLVDDRFIQVLLSIYRDRLEKVKKVLPDWDWDGFQEIRSLLQGKRTFFHCLAEVGQLDGLEESYEYVGPLSWQGWNKFGRGPVYTKEASCRVLVFLGSVISSPEALRKLVIALDRSGLESLVVGSEAPQGVTPRIHFTPAVNLEEALACCDLAVIHGGLYVLQQCLAMGKPCLILPHQVEQAQNALTGEQLGIARNLVGQEIKFENGAVKSADIVKRLKFFMHFQQEVDKVSIEQLAEAIAEAAADLEWSESCQKIGRFWQPRFKAICGARVIADAIEQELTDLTP